MNDNDIIMAMKTKYPKLSGSVQDADILGAAKIKHPNLFQTKEYAPSAPVVPAQPQGMSAGQKAGAFGVGFAQGVSDVGQRTVGRVVGGIAKGMAKGSERIGHFVAEKIKGEDIPFRNFTGQPGDRPTYGNIMSQEQQDSGRGQAGRGIGQFAGTTALTYPIGGIAGGGGMIGAGGKALFGQATTKLGGLGIGATQGAVQGAIATRVGTRAMSDRGATAGETAIGAGIGGVLGGIGGIRSVGKQNKLVSMITEKGTSKNIEKAAEQGRVKFTKGLLSTKGEITPTERVANAKDVIAREIKKPSTSNPQKLIQQIDQLGRDKYKGLSSELKTMKVGTMTKDKSEMIKQVQRVAKNADLKEYFNTQGQNKTIGALTNEIKNAKTANDLWSARIKFDKIMPKSAKEMKAGDLKSETLNKLWKDTRNIMNKKLDNIVVKQGGEGTRSKFYDMSSLIEAKDNLISNVPALAKKAPTTVGKVAKGTAAVIGGGAILNWLGKKIGGGGQ